MTNPGYFKERVADDANGNITKYLRHAHGWEQRDSLSYKYNAFTNQLNLWLIMCPPVGTEIIHGT